MNATDGLAAQTVGLLLLALAVACVAWTITHEEICRELREYCVRRSQNGPALVRKFFYLFTCEYCFSHYVAIGFVALTGFHLLLPDWRGYVLAVFALVWVANQYMSIFARLRIDIKREKIEVRRAEVEVAAADPNASPPGPS